METPDPATPDNPDPGTRPAARVLEAWWQLNQVMKRHVTPMLEREHGVSFRDYVCLNAVRHGATYPSQVGASMQLPPSAVSRMLDDLARSDLLRRSLDVQDSRRVHLEITERGHAALSAARDTMLDLLDQGLDGLPGERVEEFARTMHELAGHITGTAARTPDASSPKEQP